MAFCKPIQFVQSKSKPRGELRTGGKWRHRPRRWVHRDGRAEVGSPSAHGGSAGRPNPSRRARPVPRGSVARVARRPAVTTRSPVVTTERQTRLRSNRLIVLGRTRRGAGSILERAAQASVSGCMKQPLACAACSKVISLSACPRLAAGSRAGSGCRRSRIPARRRTRGSPPWARLLHPGRALLPRLRDCH